MLDSFLYGVIEAEASEVIFIFIAFVGNEHIIACNSSENWSNCRWTECFYFLGDTFELGNRFILHNFEKEAISISRFDLITFIGLFC